MIRKSFILSSCLLLAGFQACAQNPDTPHYSISTTESVWQHHINAWNARDLDGIVADYDAKSVIVMNGKAFKGTAAIRDLFARLFSKFDTAQMHHIDPAVISGELVYIQWQAKFGADRTVEGSDTFVLKKDTIAYQTITSIPDLFSVN